jgi:hypothetical protein
LSEEQRHELQEINRRRVERLNESKPLAATGQALLEQGQQGVEP